MIDSDYILMGLGVGGAVITLINILLWHILHIILCKKYDAILFKQPYFRITELAVCRSWPLSLYRSMGYILLIGVPKLTKKRRFKGVTLDDSNGFLLVFVCKMFLLLVVLGLLFILIFIVWGAII